MNNKISRSEFLKRSSIGVCGLFMGIPTVVKAAQSEATSKPNLYKSFLCENPDIHIPNRLSEFTHHLASRGLSGEFGRSLVQADWSFPEKDDPMLSNQMKYGCAAMSIAKNAPIRIIPGELIVGSATLRESAQHKVPLLNVSSISHTTLGFERILEIGYKGLRNEIEERLKESILDEEGTDLLKAMLKTIDAAECWNKRNIACLEELKRNAPQSEHAFYETEINILKRVPYDTPCSFREALQSLWSMYAFQRLMGNWSGIGRFDRMLGKYLKTDLKNKILTLDEARELVAHFWIKGTEWIGEFNPTGDAQFYQNIVLGGIDKDNKEVTNDLTYLVLDVIEELHISDYPVAVRLGDKTPEKLYKRIAEVQRYGGGIVSVYNENIVIEGLLKFGYPIEEAREFTNDGCWEAIIPGKSAFIYYPSDMVQTLQKSLGLNNAELAEFSDFEDLYANFIQQLDFEIQSLQDALDRSWQDKTPCVAASMFVEGCIEKGRSYNNRGPKYSVQGIHYGGISDVANSLLVIKKLVFEDKYLAISEFLSILKNNWDGNEGLRRLIQQRFTFYGNDDYESDEMMKRVFNDYSALVGKVKERNGVRRPCGISTFGREIEWRNVRKATAQGHRSGEILATNCSPTPGSDKQGPTSCLNSYCKLDFTKTCNGATLELKILPNSIKGENGLNALVSILKVFKQQGGFYLNIDTIDSATLIDAQHHPEKYPNLPVRVAGWSARFTTLSKEWQDMLIQRTNQIV